MKYNRGAKKAVGLCHGKGLKKPWVTEEMVRKMDESRKGRVCQQRMGKEYIGSWTMNWRDRQTEEESSDHVFGVRKLKNLQEKVRWISDIEDVIGWTWCTGRKEMVAIIDQEGKLLTNKEEKSLHRSPVQQSRKAKQDWDGAGGGSGEGFSWAGLLDYSEIKETMRALSKLKAEGLDRIPSRHWVVREKFVQHCKKIYVSGECPEDFLQSVMVPLEKKKKKEKTAVCCQDFRTISLIFHVLKVVLRGWRGEQKISG